MLPGEMVLYESHSVIHGRPYPLKGRFMANIFIHFEPTGHSLRHNLLNGNDIDVDQKYRQAQEKGHGGHENEEQDRNGLPPYVILGSEEEGHWRMQNPSSGPGNNRPKSFTTGSTVAHTAAQEGKLDVLKDHVARDKKIVHAVDSNGWTPLHEVS
jgi:prolyl 4-hydroxylase